MNDHQPDMNPLIKTVVVLFVLCWGILYADNDISKLSDEQILIHIGGVGKYDENEFKSEQGRFHNNEAFWYGIKSIQAQQYNPAIYWFIAYTKSARDDKMGPVFGAHAMLKTGDLEVAQELYEKSTSKYGTISNAEKGRLILYALMNAKKREADQVAATLKLMDVEKDALKRISYARVIMPAAIYLRQKDVFEKIIVGLSFDQLVKYKDLALNFAKGVSLFEIKDEYKRADEVLKSINMEVTATLAGATIFKIEPDTVDKSSPLSRSRAEKIATVYFDLDAAGWGDEYDFPSEKQPPKTAHKPTISTACQVA
ncbi:MAG: hypothetical protein LBC18_03460 [Opitutaceae bacterium]|jgi:hypothetical protein|nr:hypothetical protein [Opitutaceae bacterium]